MKALIMMLLITLNSSCKTLYKRPKIKPKERCAYSVQFESCRCRMYDLYNAKPSGSGYDMPADYCDDILGFKVEDWLKSITPWAKENIRLYDDSMDN